MAPNRYGPCKFLWSAIEYIVIIMKKILLLFVLILPIVKAALVVESFEIPNNIEEGDTFDVSLALKNTGTEPIGTTLSPLIATLSSAENCIINTAKIVGILNPAETKNVKWVVTAPIAGSCQLTASMSAPGTYTSEGKSVVISSSQETSSSSSSSSSSSAGGGADGAGGAGGSGGQTTTLEPGSVPEEQVKEEQQSDMEKTQTEGSRWQEERNIDIMVFVIAGIIAIVLIITVLILIRIRKRKKKANV